MTLGDLAHTVQIDYRGENDARDKKDCDKPIVGTNAKIQNGAKICTNAKIGENCIIMAGAYIGKNAIIGDNTIIYPNAVICDDCLVGANCIIHAGAVIGSDGFGFASTKNGIAVIEDDCEIGANTTIDRAVFGQTIIKKGSKIDNLVQIGHNCDIGEYSIIVSQTNIADSTKLGRNVVMGGQSATSGHLEIGAFTTIAARGAVTKSVPSKKTYAGAPALEHRKWLKIQAKLAAMVK